MSSSRFVSGGTIDNPPERDDEWMKAQQEVEENRLRKEEEGRQEGGKSLYEVLQANKAAKQEAFEESIRLRNQFRTLDDDEAEFINSVLESTRQKEAAIKKETAEQLELFRRHQEEAEKVARAEEDNTPTGEDEQWIASGRKRKKGHEKGPLKGLKLRKSSSTSEQISSAAKDLSTGIAKVKSLSTPAAEAGKADTQKMTAGTVSTVKGESASGKAKTVQQSSPGPSPSSAAPKPGGLLLANYSSDEDE